MNFDLNTIARIIRGIIGLALIIGGILYNSVIGFIGAFILLGAITGGCGFGSNSCQLRPIPVKEREEPAKQDK